MKNEENIMETEKDNIETEKDNMEDEESNNLYDDYDYEDYEPYEERHHYGEYAGSYAQDVMGYDDETIDDAFDGEPDAYWNID